MVPIEPILADAMGSMAAFSPLHMNSTLDLRQFNHTQLKLLYCAADSPQYTTDLLIERDLPGRASPPPDLDQGDLNALVQAGWVKILGKQIDIEPSIAVQIQHQRLITAIDDPTRAELIAAAQPRPPKVVMACIQYQLSDRAILALSAVKAQLKAQFERSEPPDSRLPTSYPKEFVKRIYVMSGSTAGNFSVRIPLPITASP